MQDFFLHFSRTATSIREPVSSFHCGGAGYCAATISSSDSPYAVDLHFEEGDSGGVAILYGSLWNFEDLSVEYASEDPATILWRGWRERGSAFPRTLRGPVAGAVYSGEQLWVFRDRMGMAPLFFYDRVPQIAVTSNPAEILENVDDRFSPNRRRLVAALNVSYDAARDYYFEGIERVRPREVIEWQLDTHERNIDRYWAPESTQTSFSVPPDVRLRSQLEETIAALPDEDRWHAVSGGLDSSVLLALDYKLNGDSNLDLQTGSQLAKAYPATDETEWIDSIRARVPLEHHSFDISDHGPLSDVRQYQLKSEWGPEFIIDECWWRPFLSFMSARTDGSPVVLGFGGDRLFSVSRKEVLSSARQFGLSAETVRRIFHGVEGAGPTFPLRLIYSQLPEDVQNFGRWLLGRQISRPWHDPSSWLRFFDSWSGVKESAAVPRMQLDSYSVVPWKLWTNETWPTEKLYLSLQRRSRRSGVKFVCPLLDGALWEVCAEISMCRNRDGTRNKELLRKALRDELPTKIVEAPNHTNYTPILTDALGRRYSDVAQNLMADSALADLGILDVDTFRTAFRGFCRATRDESADPSSGYPLWQVLAAEQWLRAL